MLVDKINKSNNSKRIAIINDDVLAFGGVEVYILQILRLLDTSRFSAVVLIPGFDDKFWTVPEKFKEAVKELKVELKAPVNPGQIPFLKVIKEFINLCKLIKAGNFDVVHIHTCRPDGARKATLAAKLTGVPTIIRSEHLPPSENMKRFSRYTVKPFDLLTTRLIVGSKACYEEQVRLLGRNPAKIITLRYGIELEKYNREYNLKEAKKKLGLDPSIPVVGTVSRFSPEKGLVYFVEAADKIINEWGSLKFLMVGDGELLGELKKMVWNLQIEDYFVFAGFQQDVTPYIEAMDITVMPSLNEGISLAMLQFMAMGKPVVATNEPSFKETIENYKSGILVEIANSNALARAIIKLLKQPDLATELALKARHEVKYFDVKSHINELQKIYEKFCKK